MTNDVTVRPGRPADLAAVLALAPRLVEGAAPWRSRDAFLSAAQGWLEASWAADDDDHATRVATRGDEVVGVAAASLVQHFTGDRDCYLGELVVHPAHEGRGIGRMLVGAVEEWALDRGAGVVRLDTGAANHAARSFYERLGFVEEQVQLTRVLRS